MIAEGSHSVRRIIAAFTGESAEKKTPYYGVEFETVDGETIFWIAYLTDSTFVKDGKETTLAKENMKTLVKLGFAGRSLADLSDTNKDVEDLFNVVEGIKIVVEHEEFDKEDGTTGTSAKVKFVNIGYGPAKFDHKQAVVKFKSLGLDGELLKLQKELGTNKGSSKKKDEKQEDTSGSDSDFTADDIPF
jgi:hypothetical protein